jgi:hypothetical protein
MTWRTFVKVFRDETGAAAARYWRQRRDSTVSRWRHLPVETSLESGFTARSGPAAGTCSAVHQPGTLPFTKLASGLYMMSGSSVAAPEPSVLFVGVFGQRLGHNETADVLCNAM